MIAEEEVLSPAIKAGIQLVEKMKKGEPVTEIERLKAIFLILESQYNLNDLNDDKRLALIYRLTLEKPRADKIQ